MARILVIEDNRDNLELMTYLLEAYGHTVSTAEDGEQGISLARKDLPHLIVCDIHLPGADGYAVARTLKQDAAVQRVPIVAVTALAMVGDREKVLAAGFDGYITKPIEPEKFVGQIDQLLVLDQRGHAPESGFGDSETPVAQAREAQATIIVVDDSPTNQELIYQTLTPVGYDVRLADSVQHALELMRGTTPDLILSDLHMPDENGFHLVRSVKADARLAEIPFVFISSSVWGEHDRDAALKLGVTLFLLRPIEPRELIDEIRSCLVKVTDGDDPRH